MLGEKKKNEGSAVLMGILILSSLLIVALGVSSLVFSRIKMSGIQERSSLALFSTDAGLERILWEIRKNDYVLPTENQNEIYTASLSNGGSYTLNYATSSPDVTFYSVGIFDEVTRSIRIGYQACMPDCAGKDCGPDGCGGVCGTCSSPSECYLGFCTGIYLGEYSDPETGYDLDEIPMYLWPEE